MKNLYVIKLGSNTVLESQSIYEEIAHLHKGKNKILLICGGAKALEYHYESMNKSMETLELVNGDRARYCKESDMPEILKAYKNIIFSKVRSQFEALGLKVWCQCAGENQVVTGSQGKPLKTVKNGKTILVRDSLYGHYGECRKDVLKNLLDNYDVVCLAPPILDEKNKHMINIDADMLAANLANDLGANHVRFVTSTPGLLKDINDPNSTIGEIFEDNNELEFVKGRMKQKVRAANFVIKNSFGDVAICGPHSFLKEKKTWFWRGLNIPEDMKLINSAINISSISRDESEIVRYLHDYMLKYTDITTKIDLAGNVVCTKGSGSKKILLLGHIDTVPFLWTQKFLNNSLFGRGAVDAKSSFVNFLEVLIAIDVPKEFQVVVIGAVEEEVSSSAGAFFVRDNYEADAVIIGEPSGVPNLTLGYYGLLKLEILVEQCQEHSAGKNVISSIDQVYGVVNEIREIMNQFDHENISNIIDISHKQEDSKDRTKVILNFRISPNAKDGYVKEIEKANFSNAQISILRNTCGYKTNRSNKLVKAFIKGAQESLGIKMKFLLKKGTSDMNTLATGKWQKVPMVAYGPGDSSLDHTNKEKIDILDIRKSREILESSLRQWFHENQ